MNYRGNTHFSDLKPCKVCHMYSGQRMMTESIPEKFFVVCQSCGFKTKPHPTQNAATKEWNK